MDQGNSVRLPRDLDIFYGDLQACQGWGLFGNCQSWQQNYRGDFSDHFLDTEATAEREGVWQKRLNNPMPNQFCWVAELEGEICGFACAFLGDDAEHGTLLDNLHVLDTAKGKGIGRQLMRLVAFYGRLGGFNCETVAGNDIGDKEVRKCRIVWNNLKKLI